MNIFFLIIVSIFFFSSCSDSNNETMYMPMGKEVTTKAYKFGIHPYLNSRKMYEVYAPILDLIEAEIGDIEIQLETSANYEEYNTKLYRGDFDFSLPNPFQTFNAIKKDYYVVARMKPDSVFRGIFVARKDSGLKEPKQLIGKSVSFPAPTALAAAMMPLFYLHKNGLDVEHDIEKKYVGSQHSSILNAYNNDTIAGATWPPPWELWKKENPLKAQEMEVVWETRSLINNGVVFKKSVDKALAKRITEILINLDKTSAGKKLLDNGGFEGFTQSDNRDYELVDTFLKEYDRAIGIPK